VWDCRDYGRHTCRNRNGLNPLRDEFSLRQILADGASRRVVTVCAPPTFRRNAVMPNRRI
jgi:hypothetical protein